MNDFQTFVSKMIAAGTAAMLFHELYCTEPEPADNLSDEEAVRQAIEDIDNGDKGILYEEFHRALTIRFDLPASVMTQPK